MPQTEATRQPENAFASALKTKRLFRHASQSRVIFRMDRIRRNTLNRTFVLLIGLLVTASGDAYAPCPQASNDEIDRARQGIVRFATFNAALNRAAPGALISDLESGRHGQILAVAEILRTIRADILLLNEFDFDTESKAVNLLRANYLESKSTGSDALHYPYAFVAPANTGHDSGFDLDNDGQTGGPGDAFGYATHPGQYAMLLLSRYPFKRHSARTFQKFLWRDMPDAALPPDWYEAEELAVLRLSSKSHWDVPVEINLADRTHTTRVLVSHPVPPVFDGVEDRNGRRNFDEIRFWADYISEAASGGYIYDDNGKRGGLAKDYDSFVIMGDLNADPLDGDSRNNASRQLLDHASINHGIAPSSDGGLAASLNQGGANEHHRGDPRLDTGDFNDKQPGNLRVDYLLASKRGLTVLCASVLWPDKENKDQQRLNKAVRDASDHRAVYMDVRFNQ